MRNMRPSWTMLTIGFLVLAAAAATDGPELRIANGDFEAGGDAGPAGWRWWSRTQQGSAQWSGQEKHGGAHSVCLSHDGPRDWAFSSQTKLPAKAGEHYRVSAWVKARTGGVTVAVVAEKEGKLLEWDIGSAGTSAKDKWEQLDAPVGVPAGCDRIYVRLVGNGATLAWVDDVAIRRWTPPPAEPRPPVVGYAAAGKRVTEPMGRGLIARPMESGGVYVGWRMLAGDPKDVAFHVYRSVAVLGGGRPERVSKEPITRTTDFVDASAKAGAPYTYTVRALAGGTEGPPSDPAELAQAATATPYVAVKLQGDYSFQKVGIADLDGDGRHDFVIKQPADNIDPYEEYWKPSPDTYKLEAYAADGRFLWRYDLGWAIERGIWYSPYLVYDLDGDGKAEVIAKTGDGDPRDTDGHVTTGPEKLTVLSGLTGKVLAQADWPDRRDFPSYNYASRNQLGVAYLDGRTPCLIVERGTYNLIVVDAYEFHGGTLRKLWRWTNKLGPRSYWGQGAHWMQAVDVDGDGRDEVILGSCVLDDNGSPLWTTGLGHPDHVYVGDLDPARPGLEIYFGMEKAMPKNGMCMADAATGKLLWGFASPTRHVHSQGLCSDIDPTHAGYECYSADTDAQKKFAFAVLHDSRGNEISREDLGGFGLPAAWWDADAQRELIAKGKLRKYQGATLPPAIQGRVIAVADVLGDWREEIITSTPGELRIYTTAIPAADRRPCLMSDPIYGNDVAHATSGYYQVPTLSYDLAASAPSTAPAGESLPVSGGPSATYRNVALNPKDAHGQPKSWPHATSNSECRNEKAFFALNAINGRTENTGHGDRFPSWGPDQREDLWWKVDFGRAVEIDKLCVYIRADFPHDAYWHSATVEFSDGTRLPIRIEKTKDKQTFPFPKRTVTWLRLTGLVQAKPLGWAALTQVEVYGRDAAVGTTTAPTTAPARG